MYSFVICCPKCVVFLPCVGKVSSSKIKKCSGKTNKKRSGLQKGTYMVVGSPKIMVHVATR